MVVYQTQQSLFRLGWNKTIFAKLKEIFEGKFIKYKMQF